MILKTIKISTMIKEVKVEKWETKEKIPLSFYPSALLFGFIWFLIFWVFVPHPKVLSDLGRIQGTMCGIRDWLALTACKANVLPTIPTHYSNTVDPNSSTFSQNSIKEI